MDFLYYLLSFLLIINLIVFVHEGGHYLAARQVGVKVETFSIGMGPEIFGFTDKRGTRWSFSLFLIGGYVMMLGDGDIASGTEDEEAVKKLSPEGQEMSITRKSNWEKIWIAFGGPFFNYIYAFLMIICMSCFYGMPVQEAVVGKVLEKTPAYEVGIKEGDKILEVDGKKVTKFREVLIAISDNESGKINFMVQRGAEALNFQIAPQTIEKKKLIGGTQRRKLVGIVSGQQRFEKRSLIDSVGFAFTECISATAEMCYGLAKLFSGKQSIDNFGGVVRMAEIAGDLSKSGNFAMLIIFTISLSLNLGFINLFPLPVLDGGRILMCFLEQVARRKFNAKLQEYVMTTCAILLILLMLVTTLNDIQRLESVKKFVEGIIR